MSLFSKCTDFNRKIDYLKSHNQFFYLREMDPCSTPLVSRRGRQMIMLGSNNYLGLANHPRVIQATVDAVRKYGTGSCSSRLLTGTTSLHNQLEKKLAEIKGTEDAIVFSTGFMSMMGTITALTDEGDVILSDEYNHASIVEGCRLSKAKLEVYRHDDLESLELKLSQCDPATNKLIITDGVFSMRGSVANLPEIKRLANRYGAAIMVDDAHGTGVLGAKGHGILEYYGLEHQIELVCGTFSKTFGTVGGYTCATQEIVSFLKLNSRPFIFTASPPPSVAATVLACIETMESEPELLQQLNENTNRVKSGLKNLGYRMEKTVTPIIPILIGNDEKTFKMAGRLEDEGIIVNPVVPPALPSGESLIRISVMATLSHAEIDTALDKLGKVGKELELI